MKIVIVDNPHDARAVQKREELLGLLSHQGRAARIAAKRQAGEEVPPELLQTPWEVHVVDFMQVRDILPIRTAPCVLLLFDELEGTEFPADRVERIFWRVRRACEKGEV